VRDPAEPDELRANPLAVAVDMVLPLSDFATRSRSVKSGGDVFVAAASQFGARFTARATISWTVWPTSAETCRQVAHDVLQCATTTLTRRRAGLILGALRTPKTRGTIRLFTSVFLTTAVLLSDPAHATCDHPYWALSKGVTRHYKSSKGHEQNWKVEKVEGDKATVTITETHNMNGRGKRIADGVRV
jgi:hypothetical protein